MLNSSQIVSMINILSEYHIVALTISEAGPPVILLRKRVLSRQRQGAGQEVSSSSQSSLPQSARSMDTCPHQANTGLLEFSHFQNRSQKLPVIFSLRDN